MNHEKLLVFLRTIVSIAGVVIVAASVAFLPRSVFGLGFLALALIAVLVVPRMSLAMPRSNVAVSFSDALIFLAFLFYGPSAAILLAAVETLSNCYYNKWTGKIKFGPYMIAANTAVGAISTAVACFAWLQVSFVTDLSRFAYNTRALIATLGILAIMQFLASTVFAAVFRSLKDGLNIWKTWKKDCFSSSMTQFVGAGIAGIVYKVVNYADAVSALVTFTIFVLVYLSYRQSISEINESIHRVEKIEREKANVERERRQEAERHAHQLSNSLEQQEKANAALRKSRQDFKYAALHDSLTGLANRQHLGDMLSSLIAAYRDDPSQNFHVLFLDLKRFKNINDTLGHTIGDKVLMIAAKRFVRMLTPNDTVARLGGDEFAIILRNLSTVGKAQKVARRIANSISQPFSLSGNRISVSVNVGIAPCDAEYETPEEILRDADIAMHFAKERNIGAAVFTKELRERFLERAKLELDLRHAVERGELSMHYQPIVDLREGRLIGFEALLRWNRGDSGFIPPNKFIPLAEESGLIVPITNWILNETCSQLARWRRISPACENLIVSVNISGKHLATDDLVDDVELALDATKLPPELLKLEITESTAMENAEHTIAILNRLKSIGVQLSIDDFGTGYSSLSHLHRLPFDTLKIDRSFVSRVGENGENSEVLQTIISLAKNLKMRVIAEGIETVSQLNVLRHLGCDLGQGYLLAKPQNRENAEKMIYESRSFLPNRTVGIERAESSVEDAVLPVF